MLALWNGLGYNRRALALRRAAAVVAAHGWPDDLQALPGVGPYTAAAVASFAFGARVAAVDVNWRRVAHRFRAKRGWWSAPPGGPEVNQAMMELGATVCTARRPQCDACPVRTGCAGHADPPRRRSAGSFEGSDRQLRGRAVAALLAGRPLPGGVDRVLSGLEADGLVVRDPNGEPRLPRR